MMRKPKQYRVITYHIAGRSIEVAGLARPGSEANSVVTYLKKHQFNTLISLEDPKHNEATRETITNIPEMVYIENKQLLTSHPPTIEALEEIYKTIRDNALKGQKTAIHCQGGLGRTGSALAALKLKELLLAMPTSKLSNEELSLETTSIPLGRGAISAEEYPTRRCTLLVKQSIEMIRSQGGSYQQNYVENEAHVDRLCEYQTYLVDKILKQRSALDAACCNSDIDEIRLQVSQGAMPSHEQFAQAYSKGDIDVMKALIAGGITPTSEMCAQVQKPQDSDIQAFLDIAILVGKLETKLRTLRLQPLNPDLMSVQQALADAISAGQECCGAWTNTTQPSESQLKDVIQRLDRSSTTISSAIHRGIIRTTPVLREIATAYRIIINTLSFIVKKIYRGVMCDREPVFQEGMIGIVRQPETDAIIKLQSLKNKIQTLKDKTSDTPSAELPDTKLDRNNP